MLATRFALVPQEDVGSTRPIDPPDTSRARRMRSALSWRRSPEDKRVGHTRFLPPVRAELATAG